MKPIINRSTYKVFKSNIIIFEARGGGIYWNVYTRPYGRFVPIFYFNHEHAIFVNIVTETKNVWSDQFSRFDVNWIQTDKLKKSIFIDYVYIHIMCIYQAVRNIPSASLLIYIYI